MKRLVCTIAMLTSSNPLFKTLHFQANCNRLLVQLTFHHNSTIALRSAMLKGELHARRY